MNDHTEVVENLSSGGKQPGVICRQAPSAGSGKVVLTVMTEMLQITKTIEFAKQLVQVWTERGVEAFQKALDGCARAIAAQTGDSPACLDSRFGIVIAGVLTHLFQEQQETLIRRQAVLNRAIIQEETTEGKIAVFIRDLSALLEELAGEDEANRFSQRVLLTIRSCPLSELRNLTVESLAERLGYSRSHLSRKFRQETLGSLRELLHEEKLKRGYEILQSRRSRVSIRALSQQLGFSDPVHFSKIFREKYGISPADFH